MVLTRIAWTLGTVLGPLLMWVYLYRRPRTTVSAAGPAPALGAMPIINSAILIALAFNLVFVLQELGLVLPKAFMTGLEPVLYHNNHTWAGDHPAERLAQGSGALTTLIAGLLCAVLLVGKRLPNRAHLFTVWLVYNAINQALAQVPVATFAPGSDVGQAFAWLMLGETSRGMASLLAVTGTVLASAWLAGPLLECAPSQEFVATPGRRVRYVVKIGVLAWLLGTLLILPFRLPPLVLMIGPIYIGIVGLPWLVILAAMKDGVTIEKTPVDSRLAWPWLAALLALLILFRGVLANGVPF